MIKMPKTMRQAVARKSVRIPEPIMDEVDRIVRDFGIYVSRQQFIESAIREKIKIMKKQEEALDRNRRLQLPHMKQVTIFSVRVKGLG